MQYILFIHRGTESPPSPAEWTSFIERAEASGMFRGGSEIGDRSVIGGDGGSAESAHIAGFMRFDAGDRGTLLELLQTHPVVVHGGVVELCEMPKS